MLDGIKLIEREREEQVAVHGYDSAHDDTEHGLKHDVETVFWSELEQAALHCLTVGDAEWPWKDTESPVDKCYSRIHQLKVAGALIAAAIDQRIRAGDQNLEGKVRDA